MYIDGFSRYHPLVNFSYFTLVILFSMFIMHPIALCISLISSLLYLKELKGMKGIKSQMKFILPTLLITALINPVFNHEGANILCYLPTGNPLTLESILYGLGASTMFVTVILWFSSYNFVMTSDKFIYLFGRIIPSLSLVLSMVLRFVPMFMDKIKEVSFAQKCLGKDSSKGSLLERIKNSFRILSIMVTWVLDNALDTADSMKSRGYGLEGRTAFSIYKFEKRDKKAMIILILLSIYILFAYFYGVLEYRYFPTIKKIDFSLYSISVYMAYIFLGIFPIYINRKDRKEWQFSQLET